MAANNLGVLGSSLAISQLDTSVKSVSDCSWTLSSGQGNNLSPGVAAAAGWVMFPATVGLCHVWLGLTAITIKRLGWPPESPCSTDGDQFHLLPDSLRDWRRTQFKHYLLLAEGRQNSTVIGSVAGTERLWHCLPLLPKLHTQPIGQGEIVSGKYVITPLETDTGAQDPDDRFLWHSGAFVSPDIVIQDSFAACPDLSQDSV